MSLSSDELAQKSWKKKLAVSWCRSVGRTSFQRFVPCRPGTTGKSVVCPFYSGMASLRGASESIIPKDYRLIATGPLFEGIRRYWRSIWILRILPVTGNGLALIYIKQIHYSLPALSASGTEWERYRRAQCTNNHNLSPSCSWTGVILFCV